ncbi:hypothetical protein [Paraburkholderia sp. C35]|uniref:hypothetical protein n=1 Tax=Paraburkholderia sp. C35 TaxID=2126993 RepID=UPI0013A54FBD|nr:hypothetical protein [Paraburkholderia sp. C35]
MNKTPLVQRRGVEAQVLLHRAYPYNRNKHREMQTIFLEKSNCLHSIIQLSAYIFLHCIRAVVARFGAISEPFAIVHMF